jgi:outer membrane autotransporter protein
LVATAALVAVTSFAPGAARAQDATWLTTPASGDFNTQTNWIPPTAVPTGTATFGTSNITALTFSAATAIGGWTFSPGASAYAFTNSGQTLQFDGAGIVIGGGSASISNSGVGGILQFFNASTAGNVTIANTSSLSFNDSSTAGSATITNGSFLIFNGSSTAGSARIINDDTVSFNANSTAGSATITNNDNLNFNNRSTAGNATITNASFGSMVFNDSSTAGDATITSNGNVFFESASTAGNATINNSNNVFFSGTSTAGTAAITNTTRGAVVDFSGSTGPAGDRNLTVGSIAGAGSFVVGGNELTVGGNNMSTEVSGDISGSGSLVKIGTGTLTLSGNATLGGTTIDGGTLAVNGGALNVRNSTILGSTAGTSGALDIGASGRATITQNLVIGLSGVGALAIQNGGTLTDAGGFVGDLRGSPGTVTVSGSGSTWTNRDTLQVGALGTGTLTLQDGGIVNSGGGASIGLTAGSIGTVTVTDPGSTWNNSPGGGLNIGSFGTGTLTIANGGTVINNTAFTANIGEGAGSHGMVTVTGAGSTWSNSSGLNIGNLGTGTLTIADSGIVTAGPVVIATNVGSVGTLNIGEGAGSPAAAPGTLTTPSLVFGAGTGTINFNHTFADYVFAPAISGNGTVNVLAGTTTVTGANSYSGATNIDGGILRAGAPNTFSPNSAVTIASSGTLDLNGFSQTVFSDPNAGLVNMGTGTAPGTILTMTSYTGAGGTIAMNTFLGGDGSPSDKLVINGGSATGNSMLRITNEGGPGAETTGNGILVVQATNGATTAPSVFMLSSGELRGGAFDYDLFRGGVSGSPNDWFLRSDFVVPPVVPPGTIPPGVLPPVTILPPTAPGPLPPIPPFPTDPPPSPLPPGAYPIIGPELATDGVVQPIARQMALTMLGTLHERIGDTLTVENAGADAEGWGRSGWARFFGQQIDNRYQAFADPSTTGRLFGVQAGFDIWRGSFIPGHRDATGVYFAYGNAAMDVNGLVTNAAATAYVQSRTGTVNLDAYSGGAYWTHYGPGGWYLDAVVQGTAYTGNATTQFANLPTTGSGIITSLEAGYPIPLPLGPRFVLEPQGQILWQHTSFSQANDGLGAVALGTTSGATGRIGLRAQSTIITDNGQVWQPYVRANLWQNWGGEATTTFGVDAVPLLEQSTQLEFAAGVTTKLNTCLSLYAQAGYEFAVGGTDGGRRQGVKGDFGLRLTFGQPLPPPAAPAAVPAAAAARSYLVFFDWDKATLTDRARQIIREAADNSTHIQYTRIEVNGYTDTSGTPRYNQGLSVRRAQAVSGELVRDGVPAGAISIRGFGETNLLVPTGPGVREPQNRRVEIIIR